MKTVALIPLRGGSKRLPRKNILPFCGKPLCYWALKAACECEQIDEVWVSTDDVEIKEVVNSFGMPVKILDRPAELAQDDSTTEEVMKHFEKNVDFDKLVVIQATNPYITSKTIDTGIATCVIKGFPSGFSATRIPRCMYWVHVDKWNAAMEPANFDPLHRVTPSSTPIMWCETGAYYIISRINLINTETRYGVCPVPLETIEPCTDIDDQEQFDYAEQYAKEHGLCNTLFQCESEKAHTHRD